MSLACDVGQRLIMLAGQVTIITVLDCLFWRFWGVLQLLRNLNRSLFTQFFISWSRFACFALITCTFGPSFTANVGLFLYGSPWPRLVTSSHWSSGWWSDCLHSLTLWMWSPTRLDDVWRWQSTFLSCCNNHFCVPKKKRFLQNSNPSAVTQLAYAIHSYTQCAWCEVIARRKKLLAR